MKTSDKPTAQVKEIAGQLVRDDPVGLALMEAVDKTNCLHVARAQCERVDYFARRIVARQVSPASLVIVLFNVDDRIGSLLADMLMPDHDWQAIRDLGQVPFARGLAPRKWAEGVLDHYDLVEKAKLQAIAGTAVLVRDFGVFAVFDVSSI